MKVEVYRRSSLWQRFLRRIGARLICATDANRIVIEVPGIGRFERADKVGKVI